MWIGLNVIVLQGVKIGDGAVIGAGSIVTKDVKPYEIVGGIPASHIKYRFNSDKIKFLQKIKWWNWSEEKVNANIKWIRNEVDNIID